ncbi:MAG: ABC transporter ATP-binding protein [Mucilaginibacter sp.]
MAKAIKVENLSKAYQLGDFGTGTISRDLERFWARIRGKEDPFLKIGEVNDRTKKGESDIVWSLKDINFEIEQGDAVGIIGRNGAGKSTLLKILSRVTTPTTGSVKVKGRIASLLEVGTGFHPELTGKENIFLNGAILGMRKAEIKRKFDEIVDFAGVERYIDTPVKRYSSGMYVRLAFAVAAHLESEILIVDEVLAVGDAEFQKKCLGKMGDVSMGEGRTILFVSHNMASVKALCKKGFLLSNGMLDFEGSVENTIERYITNKRQVDRGALKHIAGHGDLLIQDILVNNSIDCSLNIFEDIEISIKYSVERPIHDKVEFFIIIYDHEDNEIVSMFQRDSGSFTAVDPAGTTIKINFKNLLKPGSYQVSAGIFDTYRSFLDWVAPCTSFTVEKNFHEGGQYDHRLGKVYLQPEWS